MKTSGKPKHPDFEALFELARSGAGERERRDVELHLGECPPCREAFLEANLLAGTVRSDALAAPPGRWVSRAVGLWRREHPGALRRAARVLRAVLVFDSHASSLAPAFRSTAPVRRPARARPPGRSSLARRLLYRAGDLDLDLEISQPDAQERSRGAVIRGQLLGLGEPGKIPGGHAVRLEGKGPRGDERKTGGRVDAGGRFTLAPVAAGRYRLTVEGKDLSLVVDRLDVM